MHLILYIDQLCAYRIVLEEVLQPDKPRPKQTLVQALSKSVTSRVQHLKSDCLFSDYVRAKKLVYSVSWKPKHPSSLQITQNGIFCKGKLSEKIDGNFLLVLTVSLPVRWAATSVYLHLVV